MDKLKIGLLIIASLMFRTLSNAQQSVVINGVNRTGQQLYLEIDKWSKSFDAEENVLLASEKDINDSCFTITIKNVNKPVLCYIRGIGISNHDLLITPGDNLSLEIDKQDEQMNKIFFKGKNSINYNYDIDLTKAIVGKFSLKTAKNWNEYKAKVDSIQSALTVVTNKYMVASTSPLLKKILKLENLANYYTLIDGAYYFRRFFTDSILPKPLINISSIPFNLFTDTSLLVSRKYTLGLSSLVNIINDAPGFSWSAKNLEQSHRIINNFFKGKTKEYLLANLFHSYAYHAQLTVDTAVYERLWRFSFNTVKDNYYKKWLKGSYIYYFKVNKPFPQNVLNESLKDNLGKTITLNDILLKYKGKNIVIDFWATWCGPCRQEFREGRDMVEKLKSKGYQFVYISIDKPADFQKMRADADLYKLTSDSYIISDKANSQLANFLTISFIPRYVLLSKDGTLKNLDMPKPSNQLEFAKILSQLN